nr:malectin-like carbohydrate-binding domain-containing protein [Tanacetum cinerariifolium]
MLMTEYGRPDLPLEPSLPPAYLNMYFSEVNSLGFSEKRSFNIEKRSTIGNTPVPPPVLPPYRKVAERSLYNFKVDYNTNLSLVATSDSDLPPIINAYELSQSHEAKNTRISLGIPDSPLGTEMEMKNGPDGDGGGNEDEV